MFNTCHYSSQTSNVDSNYGCLSNKHVSCLSISGMRSPKGFVLCNKSTCLLETKPFPDAYWLIFASLATIMFFFEGQGSSEGQFAKAGKNAPKVARVIWVECSRQDTPSQMLKCSAPPSCRNSVTNKLYCSFFPRSLAWLVGDTSY